jgi:hypothetical protein
MIGAFVSVGVLAAYVSPSTAEVIRCPFGDVETCRQKFIAEGWKRQLEGDDDMMDAWTHFEIWVRTDQRMLCAIHQVRSTNSMLCLPLTTVRE